jgi:glutamyl/glutaminyl-tRNA synthetase
MTDFALRARPFLAPADVIEYEREAVDKHLQDDRLDEMIPRLADDLAAVDPGGYTAEHIEEVLRARAESEEVKAGTLIHAARVLVLGTKVSPGIFEVLELMGRDRTVARLRMIEKMTKRGQVQF